MHSQAQHMLFYHLKLLKIHSIVNIHNMIGDAVCKFLDTF